ncbi:MAG: hypothetical protein OEZ05_17020 [Nitrospirota bacterium]|nr:hypothetical protein [Nitrospirota bacterium]
MRPTTLLIFLIFLGLHPATALGAPDSQTLPEVELDQAVHFQSSHGDDVLVPPGTYQVTAAKDALRLTPHSSPEGNTDPVLVQASTSTHELKLGTPELLSIVGEDGNTHHLVYLMPGGQAREAVGSYSEVRTRAVKRIWSQRINRPQVYRQYTSIPALQARVGSNVISLAQLSAQMTRLQAKMLEIQEAIFDENIDNAKDNYEEAKEQFKRALRIIQELQERQTQVVNKITK